jgi:hypothetical protein
LDRVAFSTFTSHVVLASPVPVIAFRVCCVCVCVT